MKIAICEEFVQIYIYIYMDCVQVIPSETLSNITPLNIF